MQSHNKKKTLEDISGISANEKSEDSQRLNDLLRDWIMQTHFNQFTEANVIEISEAYLGIYSNRPTSWQAVLARNPNINKKDVISLEENSELMRIPGMRRSKFLIPRSISNLIFNATRLPLKNHVWRLNNEGLTLEDYIQFKPKLIQYTKNSPVQLNDIKNTFNLMGSQASAYTTVATYDGVLVRSPSSNTWSNRWLYVAAPSELIDSYNDTVNQDQLQYELACLYVDRYSPVTVEDLSWWMGISNTKARLFIEKSGAFKIRADLWISKSQKEKFESFCTNMDKSSNEIVRFLPSWDPLLMGYSPGSRQRSCLGLNEIGAYDRFGNGLPIILIGSKAITTWKITAKGSQRLLFIDIPDNITSENEKKIREAAIIWAKQIDAIFL